jgi:hypothetical protein
MLVDLIVVATVFVVSNDVTDIIKDRLKNNFLESLL